MTIMIMWRRRRASQNDSRGQVWLTYLLWFHAFERVMVFILNRTHCSSSVVWMVGWHASISKELYMQNNFIWFLWINWWFIVNGLCPSERCEVFPCFCSMADRSLSPPFQLIPGGSPETPEKRRRLSYSKVTWQREFDRMWPDLHVTVCFCFLNRGWLCRLFPGRIDTCLYGD